MTIRPTRLDGAHCQTQATGREVVRYPFLRLVRQFFAAFGCEALHHLSSGPDPDIDRLLHEFNLDETTLDLSEAFDGIDGGINPHRFRFTRTGLLSLARLASDFADNRGGWREFDLDTLADEAMWELMSRARDLVTAVREQSGSKGAMSAVTELRDRIAAQYQTLLASEVHWSTTDKEQLEDSAYQLRSAGTPSKIFWKIIVRFAPNTPARWWSKADSRSIESRILPVIARLADRRIANLVRQTRLRTFERLLGDGEHDGGLIGQLLQELNSDDAHVESVKQSLHDMAPAATQGSGLFLVRHIDDVIDRDRKLRLRHVFQEITVQSGQTPQRLAEQLRQQGVVIDGVRHRPVTWTKVDAVTLARAIYREVGRFLGYRGSRSSINSTRPQTTYDHLANIALTHPALRPALERLLTDFERRAEPYGTFEPMRNLAPEKLAFLYCYPTDRPVFEQLLQVELANRSDSDTNVAQQYQLGHPYSAVLLHYAIGGPGGAQLDLQRAMRCKVQLRATTKIQPMFREHFPEVRLLPHRSDTYEDSVQLLVAAEMAQVLLKLDDGSYGLLKQEPRLTRFFAPTKFEPQWQPAEFFSGLLNDGRIFFDLVQAAFPTLSDWPAMSQRLKSHVEPASVANELTEIGVLIRNPHELYQMAVAHPPRTLPIPPGLYNVVSGPIQGLARDAFISHLLKHDWLYNTVFWQVADALDGQRISAADVPPFLLEYLQYVEQAA